MYLKHHCHIKQLEHRMWALSFWLGKAHILTLSRQWEWTASPSLLHFSNIFYASPALKGGQDLCSSCYITCLGLAIELVFYFLLSTCSLKCPLFVFFEIGCRCCSHGWSQNFSVASWILGLEVCTTIAITFLFWPRVLFCSQASLELIAVLHGIAGIIEWVTTRDLFCLKQGLI